jgi:anti-anti-sigma factor
MNLTLSIDHEPPNVTLHLTGDLDYLTADHLVGEVSRALGVHDVLRTLRLDFGGVTFCDSAGLSALLDVRRQTGARGVRLYLDQRSPHLDRLLDVTGVLAHLTAHPDRSATPGTGAGRTSDEDTG